VPRPRASRQVPALTLVCVAIAGCSAQASTAPIDLGTPQATSAAPTSAPARPVAPSETAPDEPGEPGEADVQVRDVEPAPPTHLTVGEGVSPVVPVGTDEAQTLQVPGDVETLGWWRDGARPGDGAGFVVVTGHATRDGGAPANRWWDLEPGDVVSVATATDTLRYEVTSRTTYPYDDMPYERWFPASGSTGAPGLALITCSDFRDGAWHANTVVEAVPLT
jgi:hypothetical protein